MNTKVFGLTLLLSLIVISCSSQKAEVVKQQGDIYVNGNLASGVVKLKIGDTVETSKNAKSFVDIKFKEGHVVRVKNGKLQINTNDKSKVLALKSGKLLDKPTENAYMTDLLQAVIDSGKPISSVPIAGNWIEVDTVDDLESNITASRLKIITKT